MNYINYDAIEYEDEDMMIPPSDRLYPVPHRVISDLFPMGDAPYCEDISPDRCWMCTREGGHTGVHVGLYEEAPDEYKCVGIWGEPSENDFQLIEHYHEL